MKLSQIPKSIPLAVCGLAFALFYVVSSAKEDPMPAPLRQPPQKPYEHSIAGLGIVEGYGENVSVAPFHGGKVTQVLVKQGQRVKAGDILYTLDSEELEAQLQSNRSDMMAKEIYLQQLKHQPRKEDIPPLQASLRQAEANYQDLKAQVTRWEAVTDKRAISQDELTRKRFMLNGAKAQMEKTQADLNRMLAGAWIYDIQKADADYWASKAKMTQTQVLLNQTKVKAPRDGEILQVNIRAGEYVADNPALAPVLLGDTHKMQVRVDIDEINASDVVQNMKASASIKGDPQKKFPLEFVRIEPYMVPKKNLSGVSTERVDVRVLQLIYSFNPQSYTTYVGQQVDVFLDKEG